MKFIPLFISLLLGHALVAQKSELLIPKDAVTVFSINNISLLQKISMDDLVKYEFMEEVQQELFDGSTTGKTVKDAGIDFDQKLNIFYGRGDAYEVSGFTFGVKDEEQLFRVFDDFEKLESPYPGISFYGSYFNNLILRGNSALLIRVEPLGEKVDEMTDSIWYSRGNENPWDGYAYEEDDQLSDSLSFPETEEFDEEEYDEEENEGIEDPSAGEEEPEESVIEEDLNQKNYFELRDSVQVVMQTELLQAICNELLLNNVNLVNSDLRFAEQLTHTSEGVFYLDNSRNIEKAKGLWYFQSMFPSLYNDLQQLYAENIILGDLLLKENSIEFLMEARYGKELGSIYQKMNDSKFDKNVLKYIPESNTAYFTYNVDMREAYEQAYKVIMPILTDERNPQISTNVLTLELLNEFVNKDALFGTYKGSLFGTFNGIKKIKTTKIVFSYDEETFDYTEEEVEAEEDMPIFTLGFTTERGDIPEKVLKHLSRITSRFENRGEYWVYKDAILESADLYMIHKNGLFIFTNDEDLALNHVNGYGRKSLNKKQAKLSQKSGFVYGKVDWAEALNRFPKDFFNAEQNAIIDALRGKTGAMELTSSKTSAQKTNFKLVYNFEGEYTNSGKYLLDLLNSIYVISK